MKYDQNEVKICRISYCVDEYSILKPNHVCGILVHIVSSTSLLWLKSINQSISN